MTSLPIPLPDGFSPVVTVGKVVKVKQVLATRSVSPDSIFNISGQFKVAPHEAYKYVKKNPGDSVRVGDVLAEKKQMMGLKSNKVTSDIDGTIMRFERNTGSLVVRKHTKEEKEEGKQEELRSPIEGTVRVCNNEQIVIDTTTHGIGGIAGVGENVQGTLRSIQTTENQKIDMQDINPEMIEKIVFATSFTREALMKAIGIGAKGIVTVDFSEEDHKDLLAKNMQISLVQIKEEDISRLRKWNDKTVYLDPQAQSVLLLHI